MRKKNKTGLILGLAVLALASVAVLTLSGETVAVTSFFPERVLGLLK